jgi:hypothetical protein
MFTTYFFIDVSQLDRSHGFDSTAPGGTDSPVGATIGPIVENLAELVTSLAKCGTRAMGAIYAEGPGVTTQGRK